MSSGLGALTERVALDAPVRSADSLGGYDTIWEERFPARAEFRYERGREAVQSGGLTGTATFKVKIKKHSASAEVTTEYRLRDLRRNVAYNVREVDAISDRTWVWLIVESGVAV